MKAAAKKERGEKMITRYGVSRCLGNELFEK